VGGQHAHLPKFLVAMLLGMARFRQYIILNLVHWGPIDVVSNRYPTNIPTKQSFLRLSFSCTLSVGPARSSWLA